MVNVFIADSSRMACQLMAAAVNRGHYGLKVVGYATNSEEIYSVFADSEAHVAVISAQLKEGATAGFDLTRRTRRLYPGINVIMMLDSTDRATVIEAFQSGATGIFCRDESFELLCKCILVVHQGQIWAGSKELRFLTDLLAQRRVVEPVNIALRRSLTKRENSIVSLIAEGLTNRDIARQLNLSEHTVRNYLFRIFNKVGISNRLELAVYALHRNKEDIPQVDLALRNLAS